MPHILFNGERHNVTDERADAFQKDWEALKPGGHIVFSVTDDDGDLSRLLIAYGAPVTINGWEEEPLTMPEMPDIPGFAGIPNFPR